MNRAVSRWLGSVLVLVGFGTAGIMPLVLEDELPPELVTIPRSLIVSPETDSLPESSSALPELVRLLLASREVPTPRQKMLDAISSTMGIAASAAIVGGFILMLLGGQWQSSDTVERLVESLIKEVADLKRELRER